MSGRPREMPESFGELSAPGAEAKSGFAALEEENSLLRPLSSPPPGGSASAPPRGVPVAAGLRSVRRRLPRPAPQLCPGQSWRKTRKQKQNQNKNIKNRYCGVSAFRLGPNPAG